jgi:hypothetical protein
VFTLFLIPFTHPDILGIGSGSLVTVNGITSKSSASRTPTRSPGKSKCASDLRYEQMINLNFSQDHDVLCRRPCLGSTLLLPRSEFEFERFRVPVTAFLQNTSLHRGNGTTLTISPPSPADFTDVEQMDIKFTLGQPFKPFEQLMSVFPAARFALFPETLFVSVS